MGYDVFISYKCTDENGNKTPEYKMGEELYEVLIKLGYEAFFSSDTLEKLGSSRYKADIDEALDTAKVMVVVLADPKNAESPWVQYEWDSFYNDYLSGVRKDTRLFTLTSAVIIKNLPRTLRNVQNFDYADQGIHHLCDYIKNIIPKDDMPSETICTFKEKDKDISIMTGRQVTAEDIKGIVDLDAITYDDKYCVDTSRCEEWFAVNPDIYVVAKEADTGKVIAYVNVSPVTDECYEKMRSGDFIDAAITPDMILSYDVPQPYSVCFVSIVIHPDYQNTGVFMHVFNALVKKFIILGEHDVFIRRMIADAVTVNGEKFCNLFGMKKVKSSEHSSTLYEVTLIPPKFKIISKTSKKLFDYYQKKYDEAPYLFDD